MLPAAGAEQGARGSRPSLAAPAKKKMRKVGVAAERGERSGCQREVFEELTQRNEV